MLKQPQSFILFFFILHFQTYRNKVVLCIAKRNKAGTVSWVCFIIFFLFSNDFVMTSHRKVCYEKELEIMVIVNEELKIQIVVICSHSWNCFLKEFFQREWMIKDVFIAVFQWLESIIIAFEFGFSKNSLCVIWNQDLLNSVKKKL